MSRRHYYRHKHKEEDIDVTPLLNVMVVLVAFLILSAVFSRVSIQELVLPKVSDDQSGSNQQAQNVEVIVRRRSIEIGDGKNVIQTIPKIGNRYDIPKLSSVMVHLKSKFKDKQDMTILLEPDIEYDSLIQVMDAVKISQVKVEGQEKPSKVLLFPQVSIGEAP